MIKGVARVLFLVCALCEYESTLFAQWNQLTLNTTYPSWTEQGASTYNDVVNLRPENFLSQQFADQHVVYDSSGNWIIMGYGFPPTAGNTVGDSINLITRLNSTGRFDLHRTTNPVLGFAPATPPADWTTVGGLGAGSGVTSTAPTASAGGYRYFALVPVGVFNGEKYGHPPTGDACAPAGTTTPARGWVTIAVSKTGTDWGFVPQSGSTTVSNPAQSIQLIKLLVNSAAQMTVLRSVSIQDCSTGWKWVDLYQHVAILYNKYDQRFYIALGYSGLCGLKTTWWRLGFSPASTFGLGGLERFDRVQNGFVASTGTIPNDGDVWQCNGQDPASTAQNALAGPADPTDLVMLFRSDQSFDSVLFAYKPEMDYKNTLLPLSQHVFYVRGSLPTTPTGNFVWGQAQELDMSSLTSNYANCGEGGSYYVSANQSGNDAVTGFPIPYGFVSTYRKDLYPGCMNPVKRQGVLPVQFSLKRAEPSTPVSLGVDASGNGVFEPGESVQVAPSWQNTGSSSVSTTGSIAPLDSSTSSFDGPDGASYTVVDGSASYGSIASGQTRSCTAAANCYQVSVSNPATRPGGQAHWDAGFTELLNNGVRKTWLLHIGKSFTDVPTTNANYTAIETMFHTGITAGCGAATYCPANNVTRAEMAVFILKAKFGASYVPPPCTGLFADVACPSQFAAWVEELYREGITTGCSLSPLSYCPSNPTTRAQMAVFLLKAKHGSTYTPPPACGCVFSDVGSGDFAAAWIEQLAAEGGVTPGVCAGSNKYCPNDSTTRGQMAGFITNSFGLKLYGP